MEDRLGTTMTHEPGTWTIAQIRNRIVRVWISTPTLLLMTAKVCITQQHGLCWNTRDNSRPEYRVTHTYELSLNALRRVHTWRAFNMFHEQNPCILGVEASSAQDSRNRIVSEAADLDDLLAYR